ncbi:MAG: hypothetical protein WA821_13230 [Anaerolineales bacterium]
MLKRFSVIFVVVALAFSIIGASSGLALSDQQSQLVVSKVVSAADQKAAAVFWTRSQIASTKALSMPVDLSPARVDSSAVIPDPLGGLITSTKAGAAAANANAVAQKAFPADWQAAAATPADVPAGTSQTYTSYYVNAWAPAQTIYPHVWVGRLSFSTTGGTSYCSATAISGNNFVTAAHCVYDTTNNVWYSNWAFSPAYRAGSTPYGTFVATACTVLTAWVNLSGGFSINGWTKYDVAVCTVGTNDSGQTLNTAVGWAGRQWNYGYIRNFFDLGYPWQNTSLGAIPNAGAYLRTCTGESFTQTTDTLGIGCNWGPGISGGPWMIGYAPNTVSGAVNSVNSGLFIGTQNLYGIRFTSSNIVPVCTARGC